MSVNQNIHSKYTSNVGGYDNSRDKIRSKWNPLLCNCTLWLCVTSLSLPHLRAYIFTVWLSLILDLIIQLSRSSPIIPSSIPLPKDTIIISDFTTSWNHSNWLIWLFKINGCDNIIIMSLSLITYFQICIWRPHLYWV